MEKDIEILEEILNRQIEDTEGTKIMKQAIENLINRVKELEKNNNQEERRIYGAGYRNGCNDMTLWNNKHYISKDKIKAKIEELEKDIEIHNIYEENWNKIEVLQELLKEK